MWKKAKDCGAKMSRTCLPNQQCENENEGVEVYTNEIVAGHSKCNTQKAHIVEQKEQRLWRFW